MTRRSQRYYDASVAIVTGGGSGIGEAISLGLAGRGAYVVVADRRAPEAERVVASIHSRGGRAESMELDVRDASSFEQLVTDVFARLGRLDFLFNNAGIGVAGEVKDLELDDWRDIVEVNLMGVVHGVYAAYGRMVAQGFGHIVNTASMSGLMPSPLTASYGMTKFGVVGLSRALRVEAAHYGVRVTALCPGVIRTPILDGGAYGRFIRRPAPEATAAAWERTRPMDAAAFAEEVLDSLPHNPNTLIVPRWWRAVDLLNRLSPELGGKLAALGFRQMKVDFDRGEPRRRSRERS